MTGAILITSGLVPTTQTTVGRFAHGTRLSRDLSCGMCVHDFTLLQQAMYRNRALGGHTRSSNRIRATVDVVFRKVAETPAQVSRCWGQSAKALRIRLDCSRKPLSRDRGAYLCHDRERERL